jgi:putative ABC transport system substrate-binding protein
MMFNPNTAPARGAYFTPSFEAACRAHGVEPMAAPVQSPADIERVMTSLGQEGASGLAVQADGFLLVNRTTIISLAARHNISAIYPLRVWARDGGLLSYGAENRDMFRRAALHVDRVLRGAKPSELPVEVPTKFELVLNLKTAKALGLTPSLTLQAIADEAIE